MSATEDQKPGLLTARSGSFPVFHSDGPLWLNGMYLKLFLPKEGVTCGLVTGVGVGLINPNGA